MRLVFYLHNRNLAWHRDSHIIAIGQVGLPHPFKSNLTPIDQRSRPPGARRSSTSLTGVMTCQAVLVCGIGAVDSDIAMFGARGHEVETLKASSV